ncbi:hypothetical protein HHI36_000496 [Cryptolaemus montrouzieri]|uniref:Uncharacterized protein n=1 Tax=Cryptolaemus montrouzieri TaxID=559131 RepID=A0ABD2P4U8_9CUCU
MNNNPGDSMKIYNIGELVGTAFPEAFTPKNIVSGFQKTGMCPFNPNIFTDDDFLRSPATDRPMNESRNGIENPSIKELDGPSTSRAEIAQRTKETSPSSSVLQPASASNSSKYPSDNLSLVTPEDTQPYHKLATSLKIKIGGRKTRKSLIVTDTPVKLAIEEEQTARRERGQKLLSRKCWQKNKISRKIFQNKILKRSEKMIPIVKVLFKMMKMNLAQKRSLKKK